MKARNSEQRPNLVFQVGDVTNYPEFASDSFDLAIDKSTIDALLCGDNSFVQVAKMLGEAQRILKTGGVYFAISYGKPESRSFHFSHPFLKWEQREFILFDADCETEEDKESKSHYIYVCKKQAGADETFQQNYKDCIQMLQEEAQAQAAAAKDLEDDDDGEGVEEMKEDDDGGEAYKPDDEKNDELSKEGKKAINSKAAS